MKDEQVTRMLLKCRNDKEYLLLFLLWRTGRRVSELLNLQVKDIDFDKSVIFWDILKKRKPYRDIIAIDTEALQLLQDYIADKHYGEDEYIFKSNVRNKEGGYSAYTRKWAFTVVRRVAKRASIKYRHTKDIKVKFSKYGEQINSVDGWHPHHFRHGFSINLLTKAQDPRAIVILKEMLSHSNINTTIQYLKFHQKDKIDMLNKVYERED